MSVVHFIVVDFNFGWWVTILGIVADHSWYFTWSWYCKLSVGCKFQVCSTLLSRRFWMVGDYPWNGRWPSWGWWLTIHGTAPVSYISVPNFKSAVHFLLVDFGEGYLLLVVVICYLLLLLVTCCCYLLLVTGGKQSPTDLDCTVRLDWSVTILQLFFVFILIEMSPVE